MLLQLIKREVFTSDTNWNVPDYVDEVEVLVVGGGGSGGGPDNYGGGGGGDGGIESCDADDGLPNTGGGGGGEYRGCSGVGGSGVVIVQYEDAMPPNEPYNPDPWNGENTVSVDTGLSVDVSSDDGNVDYVEFEIDGQTYTDTSVVSGGTASVNIHELNTGETYGWSAEACNDAGCNSNSWSFTTVHEPDQPSNPNPGNGETDVTTSENLEVDVSHPDGLDMHVSFRMNDGSGWSNVGTDWNVNDGSTASVNPELELSESYDWYVDVDTSGYSTSTTSSTWSFETEHDVSVSRES